jgi:hypothetical protein
MLVSRYRRSRIPRTKEGTSLYWHLSPLTWMIIVSPRLRWDTFFYYTTQVVYFPFFQSADSARSHFHQTKGCHHKPLRMNPRHSGEPRDIDSYHSEHHIWHSSLRCSTKHPSTIAILPLLRSSLQGWTCSHRWCSECLTEYQSKAPMATLRGSNDLLQTSTTKLTRPLYASEFTMINNNKLITHKKATWSLRRWWYIHTYINTSSESSINTDTLLDP